MKAKAKRGKGRPSKLDQKAAAKIISALREGAWRKTASTWAGVSPRTMREWMVAGKKDPSSPFGIFRRNVLEAETAAEIDVGAIAFRAAANNADYALDYMRVRWRKRWDPARKLELTGKNGKDLIPQSDPATLLEKLRKMEALGKPPDKDEK